VGRAQRNPPQRDQAVAGRFRWNTSGLYGTADGGGALRMPGFIAPTTCISQGLQSKRNV